MASHFGDLDLGYMRERANEESPKLLERLETECQWVRDNTNN